MHPNLVKNLNPEQEKAVLETEGPVLILAGAGAGKTKTITERIRHLIETGVDPERILAITFTNKAAKEMRERVEKMLTVAPTPSGPMLPSERPLISTFHALGVRILRAQHDKVGLRKYFVIFDKDDSKRAAKEALLACNLDPKMHDPGRVLSIISKEKGQGVTFNTYTEKRERNYFSNIVDQVWLEYEKILKRDNALDFDDLLLKTRDLLATNTEVREYYQNLWHYIHIDEYQDTNRVQYEISKMLVGKRRNICVVGDIDQNIYSWRGADIKNILDFEKDYDDAVVIVLEENYRSTKTILEAANTVIEKNKLRRKKNLFTSNGEGEKIALFSAFDEADEAEFIADKTQSLIRKGIKPEEIAVLYRANFQSRVLEEAFMHHGIPYQILGTRFFERKEVKDILAYIRAALDPENWADRKRIINVPARGLGKTTVAKVFGGQGDDLPDGTKKKLALFSAILEKIRVVAEGQKPSEVVSFIIKFTGLEEEWKSGGEEGEARLENAYELANFATRYDHLEGSEGLVGLLSDASLQSDQDELDEEVRAVRLMTVHSAKGLEFDQVFIAGLEDGLFPHQRMSEAGISPAEAEEERRLFYVAITRARKKVFLSYAQVRTLFGRRGVNIPSEFIFDIPAELVEQDGDEDHKPRSKPLLDIDF